VLSFHRLLANYRLCSGQLGIPVGMPPPAFKMDYAKNNRYAVGRPAGLDWHDVNTCATRLSDAITRVDPNFFHGVFAGPKWHEPIKTGGRYLPMNAGALARALRHKLGAPIRVYSPRSLTGRRGIIFFDTISGYGGTGHISLWNADHVVDNEEFFDRSPRVYFWPVH
jgi:hypothetical protein